MPATVADIHEARAGRITILGAEFAGEVVVQVVVRQKNMGHRLVGFGAVLLQPEDLGRRVPRQDRVAHLLNAAFQMSDMKLENAHQTMLHIFYLTLTMKI